MPSSSSPLKHVFWSGDLPETLFDGNRYPSHPVRINSYSRPRYLIDILNILNGMSELDVLLASPLGALFSLPVRQCAMSGQLVHQMLCRQLHTDNSDETWFLFAGQPIRFSLMEFEQITGLCCAPFPAASDLEAVTTHSEGSAPYWYTLIGRKLGGATVEDLLCLLKSDANMPAWRKFRLALIVIVEGILLCRTQPVKPSFEVVEMVKNVEFFLHYPWGRASFKRLLRMVKISDYIEDKVSLIKKLKQSSMAVHGFPLAIQLLAFRTIPLLLKYLPHAEDQSTFRDQTATSLRKCRAFHTSNILAVENDASVQILFPHPSHFPFRSTNQRDPKILNLESLISAGHNFQEKLFVPADSGISGTSTSKRKHVDVDCGDSDGQSPTYLSNQSNASKLLKSVADVDDILELKLQSFKESLMADLGYLFLNRKGRRTKKSTEYTSSKNLYRCVQSPSPVTRSGCSAVVSLSGSQSSAITESQSSSMQKTMSSQIPLSSDRRFILVFPDPVPVRDGECITGFEEHEWSEKSIRKDEGGDLVNAYSIVPNCRAIVPFHPNPDRYNTLRLASDDLQLVMFSQEPTCTL